MARLHTGLALALAVSSVSTAAFGQALHIGSSGTYGTPYATVGLGGTGTWDLYRKQGSWVGGAPTVTGSNVSGNNTQFAMTGQALGGAGWATGQLLVGSTNTTTPSTGLLYVQDLTVPGGAGNVGYDANNHGGMDIRVGFITNPSAMVTAYGGDNGPQDLNTGNRGSNGVYLHLSAANVGATTAGGTGNAWTAGYNGGFYAFNATSPQENTGGFNASSVPTQTLINSGAAPTNNSAGTAYSSPMEVSAKMFADPVTTGNVVLQVKMGNQLLSSSFDPNASVFGAGGFAWQTAKPVVYLGKGSWDNLNTNATVHMGVLAPGDANADGKVNLGDFNTLRTNYTGSDKTWSQGDFTQDGRVNLSDFNVLRSHYAQVITSPIPTGPIVLGNAAAGKIDLNVDLSSGHISLIGGTGASVSGYEIDSASGALDHTQWTSLGLSSLANTDYVISEGTTGNGPSLNGTSLDLGALFKSGGTHDLVFTAFDNAGNEVEGNVNYVPEPASLGLLGLSAAALMVRRRKVA